LQNINALKRRQFLATSLLGSAGYIVSKAENIGQVNDLREGPNIFGPREGFDPQTGTLVSMMNWMRSLVLYSINDLSIEQLDYLHDEKANSIGSLLLHLTATETYYQAHTFNGIKWGEWDKALKKKWDTPMNLGENARNTIKGNSIQYYLDILSETREKTLSEFRRLGDAWLMEVDEDWGWGPTNNYCKWFHVCEHESNHNGQIKWLKSRFPN
jgi:uncharacterized damage-inducible protein DinB